MSWDRDRLNAYAVIVIPVAAMCAAFTVLHVTPHPTNAALVVYLLTYGAGCLWLLRSTAVGVGVAGLGIGHLVSAGIFPVFQPLQPYWDFVQFLFVGLVTQAMAAAVLVPVVALVCVAVRRWKRS